ncbi:MAG TPA: DUF892 family protein [Lacipirellulaceae bacterium]|nr:DUF892 family protein [Lacipirellulaceae bacterium]
MSRTPREQLVHFLSDMYSIEQQALAQLGPAPKVVSVPLMKDEFHRHYLETQQQAEMVGKRLEANDGSPSRIKDAVMRLGGKGFLLFAVAMPETPGRLVDHAYAYEAMEWAGYEMLMRFAERAGDHETVATAETIRDQERTMMHRLEQDFGAAQQLSHKSTTQEDLPKHVIKHLSEVHAIEGQAIQLFSKAEGIAGNEELTAIYHEELEEVRRHAELVEKRLEALDSGASKIRDIAMRAGGINWGLFFQAQSDTPAKFAAFLYAVLHLAIGGYELLKWTAIRVDDRETQQLCERIVSEKRAIAERLAEHFDAAVDATLEAVAA